MKPLFYLIRIWWILSRHRALSHWHHQLPFLLRICFFTSAQCNNKEVRFTRALTLLGPTFVKLGQALAIRSDIIGTNMAGHLASLQDDMPSFSIKKVHQTIEAALGKPTAECFTSFDEKPIAAASIAQVHFATLPDGTAVAVKILRPSITADFARDIAALRTLTSWAMACSKTTTRLKLDEIIADFARTATLELDLRMEAANASKLKENMQNDEECIIPDIMWDYTTRHVLTTQRVSGIKISDIDTIKAKGLDVDRITQNASQVFFKQVYRDGMFHADMHPGNIFVDDQCRIVLVDFGIVGFVDLTNRLFLARMLKAFLEGDYEAVSRIHFEAGWIPANQDEQVFAQACRAIGEPILGKPQHAISIAELIGLLFKIADDFDMVTQPQLVLLQKNHALCRRRRATTQSACEFLGIIRTANRPMGT